MLEQEKQIKILCAHTGISQAGLARKMGMSPQNFNRKIKQGTFSTVELNKIAQAVGVRYESAFILADGTRI